MLRFLVLFLIASTAFATSNFDADYERSMKVINQSKATRVEVSKKTTKRAVASVDTNIVEAAGTLEEFMENADSDLE